ncbi:hypothetical protein [Streptomyces sp. 6N106]|uniref:hypothetical protein n=1 Tax=Streptomyces sp. 6N106 TaxID=3457418 RepID=UPI003FD5BFBE
MTTAVERVAPLFHLINGDLCYANLSEDRRRTWSDWFDMTSRSSRFRPWIPAAGNHENELGNGPIGFAACQAYFSLPGNGGDAEIQGLWYAFTVGSVRVVSLANDDVASQDAGNTCVRGYSGGAQRRWLEAELARARADRDIDWIVDTPRCNVITGVGATGANGHKTPVYVTEAAPRPAVRDRVNPYGFAAFSGDPGTEPGGHGADEGMR